MINICIIATIVIYLVGMLLVGFVYTNPTRTAATSTSAAARWARWSRL